LRVATSLDSIMRTKVAYLFFIWLMIGASKVYAELPVQLAVSTLQDSPKAGSQIILKITLINNSDHDIKFTRVIGYRQAEFNFAISVRDRSNRLLPESKYATSLKSRQMPFSEQIYTLKPDEQISEETAVSNLCDMTSPGKYLIKAAKTMSIEGKSVTVESNPMTITVTP
jgi:hypothetical protein